MDTAREQQEEALEGQGILLAAVMAAEGAPERIEGPGIRAGHPSRDLLYLSNGLSRQVRRKEPPRMGQEGAISALRSPWAGQRRVAVEHIL